MINDTNQYKHYPILSEDPEPWFHLVYQRVRISCAENRVYEGWVVTVDPLTGSLVLGVPPLSSFTKVDELDVDAWGLIIVAGMGVLKTEVLDITCPDRLRCILDSFTIEPSHLTSTNSTTSVSKATGSDDWQDHEQRRDMVLNWLQQNRVPVQEVAGGGDLVLSDVLTIRPPYLPTSCVSSNSVVLNRIMTLLAAMPTIPVTSDEGSCIEVTTDSA